MGDRKMPNRINLGSLATSTMAAPMGRKRDWLENQYGDKRSDLRVVMGYYLPAWQRGLVWTERQKIAFIESAWKGVSLGTYTYNQAEIGSPYDNLLIDGQQRLHAIECYLNNEFPVFGWRWSEVTIVDRRVWEMTTVFASYITSTEDEAYLKGYYNLMNFGGTAHQPHERA
jgi:hypothetical protein